MMYPTAATMAVISMNVVAVGSAPATRISAPEPACR